MDQENPVKALPLVSVIVPVRNGREDLLGLLAALERQTLGQSRFEVVIGDDGSTDGGTEGLETADGRIRVLPGPPVSSYVARNRAVAASRGAILAFTDADCRPRPGWLEAGLAQLEHTDVVAGLIQFQVPEHPTVWSLVDMDTFLDQERQVKAGVAVTANLFLRREQFDRVDGFEPELREFGDHDFLSRCVGSGAQLVFAAEAVVEHPTRDERDRYLKKLWIMNRWYGEREARSGRRPGGIRLRAWVPFVTTLRTRRWYGRTLVGLDRHRLGTNGHPPRILDDLRALPIIYIVQPYASSLAQLSGWWTATRARRALVAKGDAPS
jgi:glycosyltransferase involved in cell wall biosynthesis